MLAQRAVIATNRFGPRKRLRWFACAQAQPGMAQQAPAAQAAQRLLKSTIRVIDLDASVQWYTKNFGVKLLSQDGSKAQLGFGPSAAGFFTLELQGQAHGSEPIDLGEGFGHFGLAVADVYETVQHVKDNGGKVTRDAGAVKGGTTVIAFVEDPTGYKWELIGRPADSIKDPMCQVMLRVMDLQRSIKFYTEVLGLDLIRTRENPQYKYTLAFLGYGAEQDVPVFELTYNWDCEMPYAKGVNPGYAYTVVHTKDVSQLAAQAEAAGAGTVQAPADLPGAVALTDPDGWMVVLTDSA